MKAFSRGIEILAAVAILFLYPIMSMAQKQSAAEELLLRTQTVQFTDQIRTHGYLSREEYEKFWRLFQNFEIMGEIRLETIGERYDVQSGGWYEELTTNEEIMSELEKNEIVKFYQGDSLTVTVEGSFAGITGILRRIYGAEGIWVQTGGVIRDEIEPVYAAFP